MLFNSSNSDDSPFLVVSFIIYSLAKFIFLVNVYSLITLE
jgi:hypothetical protein